MNISCNFNKASRAEHILQLVKEKKKTLTHAMDSLSSSALPSKKLRYLQFPCPLSPVFGVRESIWKKDLSYKSQVSHRSTRELFQSLKNRPRKSNRRRRKSTRRGIRMRIVGLTGGIASGKSTVSNLFKTHGLPVVDADIVARDVLKKGTGGWKKVVAAFGEEILQPDGEVDRPKLGQIVFSDPGKRQLLNRLLAPYISSGIFWQIFKLWMKGSKVIILDIPLLFEAKMDKWTKPIIVVWVDQETQLKRLMARDGSNEEDAQNRINAQMSLDAKRSKADIVIDNTGSLDDLEEDFQKVLHEVTRSWTWTEFWLSRQGALWVLVSIIVGVVVCKKNL